MATIAELGVKYTSNTKPLVRGNEAVKESFEKLAPAAKKATTFLDLFKARMRDSAAHASGLSKAIQKLNSSVGRIAFYRAIRSGLRAVTQAMREGINNLYQYSAALNSIDSARAKNTMDGFATTALYAKNSIGAALMPVLQSLLPIVNTIADAFIVAANAVNQFFHALKGESVFTKAKKYAVDFGDALGGAAGAAKELKKQIFGFDELNIFNEPSGGGGGGGGGLDYSKMFEEAELSAAFQRLKQIVQENLGEDFAARFKLNFKDILFNWKGLNKEQVAKKMLTGFYGLMGGLAGFAIGGPLGAVVGTLTGVSLGVFISTIDFNGDGQIQPNEVLRMIVDSAAILTGGVVGWLVGGPMGAAVGLTVGAGLTALIKTFVPHQSMPESGMNFIKALITVTGGITGALIGYSVGNIPGAIIGMTVGAGLTFLISSFAPDTVMPEMGMVFAGMLLVVIKKLIKHPGLVAAMASGGGLAFGLTAGVALTLTIISLQEIKKEFGNQTQFITASIVEIMNLAVGAGIGFALGGPAGAVIGISIACGLNLIINKVWTSFTPESKRQMDKFGTVDQASMDAYLQFGTPSTDTGSKAVNKARGRAEGGFVPAGTYFYAGEAGPELVGTVGGRTHVTNQDQFTAGMEGIMDNTNSVIMQAASALIQAIQSKPVPSIRIGDRDIVSMYDRGKTLAGGALVE